MMNNRKYTRFNMLDEPVIVFDLKIAKPIGRVENITSAGLLLISDEPMPLDRVHQISFSLPIKKNEKSMVRCSANSLWGDIAENLWGDTEQASSGYWTGYEFLDISPAYIELIKRFNFQLDKSAAAKQSATNCSNGINY